MKTKLIDKKAKWNRKNIHERFKSTKYRLGYEHFYEKEGFDNICYGDGWGLNDLYMIQIDFDIITYKFSCATNARLDKIKVIPYIDDFPIFKKLTDFNNFLFKIN